jgi:hypothetical protein
MAKRSLDKDTKKAIVEARTLVEAIAKADSNEAETRKRIDRILETVMGYDTFKHLTQEYAIHGTGDTTHCDIAIQLRHEESSGPEMLVEVKRVNIDLAPKHIRQAASYAIDIGCEWILLTNGKDWKLYHIAYGKPPETKLRESWNLLDDDLPVLAKKFEVVTYKNVRNKGLDALWQKRTALSPSNMLKAILSQESIKLYQRRLKRSIGGVNISPEDIVSQFRHLLNESALSEMNNIKILLPARQQRSKPSRVTRKKPTSTERQVEVASSEKQPNAQET